MLEIPIAVTLKFPGPAGVKLDCDVIVEISGLKPLNSPFLLNAAVLKK